MVAFVIPADLSALGGLRRTPQHPAARVGQTIQTFVANAPQKIVRRRRRHHLAAQQTFEALAFAELIQVLHALGPRKRNRHEIENRRAVIQTPVALFGRKKVIEVLQQPQTACPPWVDR
jgi:hypothetical protein